MSSSNRSRIVVTIGLPQRAPEPFVISQKRLSSRAIACQDGLSGPSDPSQHRSAGSLSCSKVMTAIAIATSPSLRRDRRPCTRACIQSRRFSSLLSVGPRPNIRRYLEKKPEINGIGGTLIEVPKIVHKIDDMLHGGFIRRALTFGPLARNAPRRNRSCTPQCIERRCLTMASKSR